jgi:hypothetical protein
MGSIWIFLIGVGVAKKSKELMAESRHLVIYVAYSEIACTSCAYQIIHVLALLAHSK